MNKNRDILIQLISSKIVAFLLALLFTSFDYKAHGKIYIGIRINDSILYLFAFIGASLISLLFGLFIRLNEIRREWLRKKYWISLLIASIGITICILSIKDENIVLENYRMDGMDFEYWHPKYFLQASGWFISIFGLQHIFLPLKK